MRETEEVLTPAEEAKEDAPEESGSVVDSTVAAVKKVREKYIDPKFEGQDLSIDRVREFFARVYDYVDLFVGLFFVAMGIFVIIMYHNYGYTRDDFPFLDWVGLFAMFFGGTLMVVNPRRTFNTSIGFYAITMGVISFSNFWSSLSEVENYPGLLSIVSDIMFLSQRVMVVLSVNLMYSGISYLRGRPRGTVGMMLKAAFMGAVNMFVILIGIRSGEYDGIIGAVRSEPVTFIQILMFFIFLNMMDTAEARSYNTKNRLRLSTEALRHMRTVDAKSFVELADAEVLTDPGYGGWTRVQDGGPAEWEFNFAINSVGGASSVTVQRWRGDDKYYLTISDHRYGSNIRATRLAVNSIVLSEDKTQIRILGSDHFTIRIRVRKPMSYYTVRGGDTE